MFDKVINEAQDLVAKCNKLNDLQNIKVKFLGKASVINSSMKNLGQAKAEERKALGQKINLVKLEIQKLIDDRKIELEDIQLQELFDKEKLDLTCPPRPCRSGSIHPITQCLEELSQVFSKYGFITMDGPDIEDDWHNFTALNIAENHPARQMHDTFYLKSCNDDSNSNGSSSNGIDGDSSNTAKVLRTHTSSIQIRTMTNGQPPFRFIAPGRAYRSDSDMTHTPMFHQIEGLVIDEKINMGHLKYVIIDFIKSYFEKDDIEVQFRPSFFPFTEPSAEVDIRMNKNDNWLEVLGCGMVHPSVLKNVGIDHEKYQGFAFGMGLERFAMLKYGMKDLRKFFEGDKRWINHYNFKHFDIPTLAGGLTR